MRVFGNQQKVSNSNKILTDLALITRTSPLSREISRYHISRFIKVIKVLRTLQTKITILSIAKVIVIRHCQIF